MHRDHWFVNDTLTNKPGGGICLVETCWNREADWRILGQTRFSDRIAHAASHPSLFD